MLYGKMIRTTPRQVSLLSRNVPRMCGVPRVRNWSSMTEVSRSSSMRPIVKFSRHSVSLPSLPRHYTQSATEGAETNGMDEYERKIYGILQEALEPEVLDVRDVSGGCGSMFAITVHSPKFKGIPMVKQHRLVNDILADEIAQWHGLQLRTKAV